MRKWYFILLAGALTSVILAFVFDKTKANEEGSEITYMFRHMAVIKVKGQKKSRFAHWHTLQMRLAPAQPL